jgi:hypothetical protein
MARSVANVDILTDTFNTWVLRTNEIIQVINSDILTANSTQGVTGTPAAPRNALLYGTFTANTLVGNTLSIGTFVANSTAVQVGASLKFIANNSTGSPGQLLTTDGSRIYWSTASGTGTVTSLANAAGVLFTNLPSGAFGSPITSSGTIGVRAGDGIVVDSRGVSVNTVFLAASVTNASTLQNRTWETPAAIGTSTANTGTFTTVTSGLTTGYRLQGDVAFLISNSVFRTQGYVDATTPNSGTDGGVRVRGNATSGVAYIQVTDSLGSTEWGNFKAHSNGYIVWSGAIAGANYPNLIPTGTVMLFAQTNAPVGWTKITTHDNKALRVVSGTASSGGTTSFTSAFNTSFSTDGHVLTEAQLPAHRHLEFANIDTSYNTLTSPAGGAPYPTSDASGGSSGASYNIGGASFEPNIGLSGSIGSGSAHSHTLNFNVQYVDVILASKN